MRTIRYLSLVALLAAAACGSESNGPSEFDETQGASVSAPRSGGSSGTRGRGGQCDGQRNDALNILEEVPANCTR